MNFKNEKGIDFHKKNSSDFYKKKFLYHINHFMKDKENTFLIKIEWMYVWSLSDCIHNHLLYI